MLVDWFCLSVDGIGIHLEVINISSSKRAQVEVIALKIGKTVLPEFQTDEMVVIACKGIDGANADQRILLREVVMQKVRAIFERHFWFWNEADFQNDHACAS
jgi:hypothetical protein